MIRSVNSNFVCDYAVWKYPDVFKRNKTTNGVYTVKCFLCQDFYCFESCKKVEDHAKYHADQHWPVL